MNRFRSLIFGAVVLAFASQVDAGVATYYIGRDSRNNANGTAVTFLLAHGDHFHRLGPANGAPGRIPEPFVGGALFLFPGTGAFADRHVSKTYHLDDGGQSEYSNLEVRPISSLLGFGPDAPETILINGGRHYLGDLAGTNLAFELVAISDGLNVADGATGTEIVPNVGDRHVIGAGDSFAPFTPMFYTDAFPQGGTRYSATFRLVDLNGLVPSSGTFTYELQTAPEPGTLASAALGLAGAGFAIARRRRKV
ncbi:MAG: all3515 family Zur-repressed PEP-CTERM protein [Isosphaeraceae bacterium]|nr:all3515 family Zur-repressed PEP-CTERM protein [Isosphaeraceae bacterium]